MEAVKVAQKMQNCIESLAKAQKSLEDEVAAKNLSKASAAYDGAVEQAVHELQHGLNEKYGKVPVTIVKDIAKGLCKDRLADKIQADLNIKVINSRIGVLEAMLTGWQSVNKHLSEV